MTEYQHYGLTSKHDCISTLRPNKQTWLYNNRTS